MAFDVKIRAGKKADLQAIIANDLADGYTLVGFTAVPLLVKMVDLVPGEDPAGDTSVTALKTVDFLAGAVMVKET